MFRETFKKHFRLILLIFVILAIIFVADYLGIREKISVEWIRSIFEQNQLASTLIFIILFALGGAIQVPGFVFLLRPPLPLANLMGGS